MTTPPVRATSVAHLEPTGPRDLTFTICLHLADPRSSPDSALPYSPLMGCTALQTPQGLDHLITRLNIGGVNALGSAWQAWFASALEQLEADDSIEAHVADAMADALSEAEEALSLGHRPEAALQRLVALFTEARTEAHWRLKAQSLRPEQLSSTTWNDLHKALDAAAHSPALVEAWISHVEGEFLAQWDSYESSDVLPQEVTSESILGHEFLSQGLEEWLSALAELRDSLDTQVDRASVLARAEAGQRLLVAVQVIEEERRNVRQNFIAAWMN